MFECILGHENEIKILKDNYNNSELLHSYMFFGQSGIGKLKIAEEFAKIILKTDNLDTSMDYKYISKKEDKKNILVEQIREDIIKDINMAPSSGDKKIYIIDNAELLNDIAQNTLLKTLEEPPKHVIIFMIVSNISSILPTVLSRTYRINFNKLDNSIIKKYIKENLNVEVDDDVLNFADGSLGIAVDLMKNEFYLELNKIKEFYLNIESKKLIEAFKLSEEIDFTKKYYLEYLQYLFFINKNYLSIEIIEKVKERLKYNGNYDIVIDNMIINCIKV